ncbi:MAG: hypothetical protein SFZ03_03660 [Candidatus Melainabacteria bacterium]|nr:hypothetical protein [Candidatus Melainabacteria bacterium]
MSNIRFSGNYSGNAGAYNQPIHSSASLQGKTEQPSAKAILGYGAGSVDQFTTRCSCGGGLRFSGAGGSSNQSGCGC